MSILRLSQATSCIARTTLIGTIAAAPFLIGGVPALFQLWLACGVIVSFVLWIISAAFAGLAGVSCREVAIPLPFILLALLFILGACQVALPLPLQKISSPWALELGRSLNQTFPPYAADTLSIAPHTTTFQNARILIVLTAGFLGAQLFTSARHFSWLFGALATAGALIAVVGIAQKLTSDDQFLGFISLRYGASPFATFVNRNNAAGFLNICLAASIGGIILSSGIRQTRSASSMMLVFFVLSTFIVTGIIASLSRGGMMATAIALFAVFPWFYRQLGKTFLFGSIGVGAVVVLIATCFHFADETSNRLNSLNDIPSALAGRWEHWKDTSLAIADRPLLGSGWGTYRYVNLPYQQHETTVWFWNADNQFLEIAVEGGLIGLSITVGMIVSMIVVLLQMNSKNTSSFTAALAVSGLFLVISLCVQMTTDFGVTLLSIGLACSVFAGGILGTAMGMKSERRSGSRIRGALLPSAFVIPFTLLILFATSWAGLEIARAQPILSLCERVPSELNHCDAIRPSELNGLIESARDLLGELPDHSELSFELSRLLTFRFQQEYVGELTIGNLVPNKSKAWEQSSLEALFERSRLTEFADWREALQRRSSFRNSVPGSVRVLESSLNSTAWLPGTALRLMMLSSLNSSPRDEESIRRLLSWEALIAAGNVDRLITVGHVALCENFDALAILCWKRAISLKAEALSSVVQLARLGFEDDQICEQLFCTPEQLICFSKMTHDLTAKRLLSKKLETIQLRLKESNRRKEHGRTSWISAQLALLSNDTKTAIDHLQAAIRHEPFQLQWRLELAELLILEEDYPAAREQLIFASRLDPRNEEVKKRLASVIQMLLRTRKHDCPGPRAFVAINTALHLVEIPKVGGV